MFIGAVDKLQKWDYHHQEVPIHVPQPSPPKVLTLFYHQLNDIYMSAVLKLVGNEM